MKFKKLPGFRKKMVKTRNQKRQIISKKFLLYITEIWGAKENGGEQQKENDFLQKQKLASKMAEEKIPTCISPQQQQFGSHPWKSILHELWDQVGNCETPVESKIE